MLKAISHATLFHRHRATGQPNSKTKPSQPPNAHPRSTNEFVSLSWTWSPGIDNDALMGCPADKRGICIRGLGECAVWAFVAIPSLEFCGVGAWFSDNFEGNSPTEPSRSRRSGLRNFNAFGKVSIYSTSWG